MVDAWVSLSEARHRGPITVVSRNGLLSLAHKDVLPLEIDAADVPRQELSALTHWFRKLVRDTEALGGTGAASWMAYPVL